MELAVERLAKVQKNFLIPEELAEIIDKVIEMSGSNFTKIATAALLQYLFDGCANPEPGMPVIRLDGLWIRLASRLERDKLTISQIPLELLKDAVSAAKFRLKMAEDGESVHSTPDGIARLKKLVRYCEDQLRIWRQNAEGEGGDLAVVLEGIEYCFSKGQD